MKEGQKAKGVGGGGRRRERRRVNQSLEYTRARLCDFSLIMPNDSVGDSRTLTFSLLLPFWPLSIALCAVAKIEAQTVARRHRVPLISPFISLGHLDRRRTLSSQIPAIVPWI